MRPGSLILLLAAAAWLTYALAMRTAGSAVSPYALGIPALALSGLVLTFRWRRHLPPTLLYFARMSWIFLIAGPPIDAWAAMHSRALTAERFSSDWRYAARVRAVETYATVSQVVRRQGTAFDHVGPFRPDSSGRLLEAPVTTDADGYRRENGPVPTCTASDGPTDCVEATVLCVGGSTTWGVTLNASDRPYPDVLEDVLRELLPQQRIHVVNAGVSGEDVGGARTQAARHFTFGRRADVLVFYGGVNTIPDHIRARALPRVSFVASRLDRLAVRARGRRGLPTYNGAFFGDELRRLVGTARAGGAVPVLVTFALPFSTESPGSELAYWDPLVMWHTSARTMAALVSRHNDVTAQVAAEEGLVLVDAALVLSGRTELFVDEEHYTQAGRVALVELIAPAVAEILAARSASPPPALDGG